MFALCCGGVLIGRRIWVGPGWDEYRSIHGGRLSTCYLEIVQCPCVHALDQLDARCVDLLETLDVWIRADILEAVADAPSALWRLHALHSH